MVIFHSYVSLQEGTWNDQKEMQGVYPPWDVWVPDLNRLQGRISTYFNHLQAGTWLPKIRKMVSRWFQVFQVFLNAAPRCSGFLTLANLVPTVLRDLPLHGRIWLFVPMTLLELSNRSRLNALSGWPTYDFLLTRGHVESWWILSSVSPNPSQKAFGSKAPRFKPLKNLEVSSLNAWFQLVSKGPKQSV